MNGLSSRNRAFFIWADTLLCCLAGTSTGGGEQSAGYFDIALPDLTFLLASNLQTPMQ